MRVGKAPTRLQRIEYRPRPVTICMPVFIPEQFGYYQQRLDILKICVRSIVSHTSPETYDLLVFDNGSCPKVVDYLQSLHEQGIIQYLFFSRSNVGVANATRIMLHAAPGEIIAFSNDDVFFHPGWLEAHLEVLETFPRTGMVSGFCGEQSKNGVSEGAGRDTVLEHRGVKAYSTAKHFQFVARKSIILQGLDSNWYPKAMGGQREMDKRVDALGYARLTTFKRYVQHIGNVLTPEFLASLPATGLTETSPWVAPKPLPTRIAGMPFAHSVLSRLNTWSYNLLNARPLE
jgi:glycosyltransferase involved in cell wall biosynthesis